MKSDDVAVSQCFRYFSGVIVDALFGCVLKVICTDNVPRTDDRSISFAVSGLDLCSLYGFRDTPMSGRLVT